MPASRSRAERQRGPRASGPRTGGTSLRRSSRGRATPAADAARRTRLRSASQPLRLRRGGSPAGPCGRQRPGAGAAGAGPDLPHRWCRSPGRTQSGPDACPQLRREARRPAGAPPPQQAPRGGRTRPASGPTTGPDGTTRPTLTRSHPACGRRLAEPPRPAPRSVQVPAPLLARHVPRRETGTREGSPRLPAAALRPRRVFSRPPHPSPRCTHARPPCGSPGRWGARQPHTAMGERGAGPRPSLAHAPLTTPQPCPLFTVEGTGKWVSRERRGWPPPRENHREEETVPAWTQTTRLAGVCCGKFLSSAINPKACGHSLGLAAQGGPEDSSRATGSPCSRRPVPSAAEVPALTQVPRLDPFLPFLREQPRSAREGQGPGRPDPCPPESRLCLDHLWLPLLSLLLETPTVLV